jgi:26S proteasome regulatory subunit T4
MSESLAAPPAAGAPPPDERQAALTEYRKQLLKHKDVEARVKNERQALKQKQKDYERTEEHLKALQSVGQIIGEVLRQLDAERFIVKASLGPRYVVGSRRKLDKTKLKAGVRVSLDMTTLTIMRILPREVDPAVFNMMTEDPGAVKYSDVGGLNDEIRELRETIELPLTNPELFKRVGIKPPKGVLLYGPPGTGKTLLARALACNLNATFLKVAASAIVDKYIGESSRLVREIFGYAKDNAPSVIFMDEIDAIGGKRFSEGTSADREIQRTLMEILAQLDGFNALENVKTIMATNRVRWGVRAGPRASMHACLLARTLTARCCCMQPDILDPALMRPGRLDRKIEIKLPNEQGRIKIHAAPLAKRGDIDYESVVKIAEGFNGADLRNCCTEAGLFAIRAERDYVVEEDFFKVRWLVRATCALTCALARVGRP